jgi:hypothetical protein
MKQSESIATLAAAFVKAQAAMEGAKKEATNPFFKSKYADLGEVWRVVKEAFAPHGLSVIQLPETCPTTGTVTLTTTLLHESGEWLSGTMPVRVAKDDPQGVGSGITYARRYALAALCGVVADADDDGEAGMGRGNGGGKPGPMPDPEPVHAPSKTAGQLAIEQEQRRILADLQGKEVSVTMADIVATTAALRTEVSGGRAAKLGDLAWEQAEQVIARLREQWGSEAN